MGFHSQFDNFSPINGAVTPYPLSSLPDIASRARRILCDRSDEQVIAAAKIINSIIVNYRESLCDDVRTRAQEMRIKLGSSYSDDDEYEMQGHIAFIESWSDLYLFKGCNNHFDSYIHDDNFPSPKQEELFAVIALWLVGDVIASVRLEDLDCNTTAAEYALNAMEAVCYAERIGNVEYLKSDYTTAKEQFEIEAARERAEKQKLLNESRHAPNHAAKNLVLAEWEEVSKYPSAAKAGKHLAEWLENENSNYKYEARTVTGWILAHAKSIGVKFR